MDGSCFTSIVLKEKNPREEDLQTLFAEVESLINSRPLTDVAVDPNDIGIFEAKNLYMRKKLRIS